MKGSGCRAICVALRRRLSTGLLGLVVAASAATLSPTTSASAAEFEWRYYSVVGVSHPYGKILADGFKRIEERTGGKVKITLVSFGETPYKGSEAEKLMRDDLGDMTEWLLGYSTSTYPMLSGPGFPLLPAKPLDPASMSKAMDKAWETPALKQTLEKLLKDHRARRLGSFYWPPQNHWLKSKINGPAGFKGLKIREFSAEGIDFTKAIGAVPVSITAPEVYTALQRGTLDGAVTASTSMTGLKWGEVLKAGYITNHKLTISLILINERRIQPLAEGRAGRADQRDRPRHRRDPGFHGQERSGAAPAVDQGLRFLDGLRHPRGLRSAAQDCGPGGVAGLGQARRSSRRQTHHQRGSRDARRSRAVLDRPRLRYAGPRHVASAQRIKEEA